MPFVASRNHEKLTAALELLNPIPVWAGQEEKLSFAGLQGGACEQCVCEP